MASKTSAKNAVNTSARTSAKTSATTPAKAAATPGKARVARDPLAAYPAQLHHSTARADLVYERSSDLFVLPAAAALRAKATVLRSLGADNGQTLQLCSGQPVAGMDEARAVYEQRPAGPAAAAPAVLSAQSLPMVPTGQLFVRFADGVQAQARAGAMAAAGCRVVSVPAYAPQAAWLAAVDGDPAQALSAIQQLEALPDMVNVEPQWLAPRALKA